MKHITSARNKVIKQVKHARRGKDVWGEALLIEGKTLVEEASAYKLDALALFVTEESQTEFAPLSKNFDCPKYVIPEHLMEQISGMVISTGIFLVAQAPQPIPLEEGQWDTLLYLEEIQDPGNLGTLLRSARAFGVEGVLLGPGSCDPYNEKVLRAAMGAAFEMPLWQNISPQKSKALALEKSMRLVVADLEGIPAANYFKANADNALIILIGNEGRGISAEAKALADDVVTIPMAADSESLNAAIAGSILLYERASSRA